MMMQRACVLTIGTEIINGQIENRNSFWISDQLANLSIETVCHISVADDESEIIDALSFAAKRGTLVICTGGLGPTRDDITREAIARWSERSLEFCDSNWQSLHGKLESANVEVALSNKRQCYFPHDAIVFSNPAGTADAFAIEHHGLTIIALPGPPREIAAIWPAIAEHITSKHKSQDPLKLMRYQCLGLSESRLGEIVEKALEGSRLVTGYRPHIPYVEVKIWAAESYLEEASPYLDALENSITPWLTTRDDEDLAKEVLLLLSGHDEVQIVDAVTQGHLAARLGKATLSGTTAQTDITTISRLTKSFGVDDWSAIPKELIPDDTTVLALYVGEDISQWEVVFQQHGHTRTSSLKLPFRPTRERHLRAVKYVTEMTLHVWKNWLMEPAAIPGNNQPQ